jgi:hypothetical protein
MSQYDPEFQYVQGHFRYMYVGDLAKAKRRLQFAA